MALGTEQLWSKTSAFGSENRTTCTKHYNAQQSWRTACTNLSRRRRQPDTGPHSSPWSQWRPSHWSACQLQWPSHWSPTQCQCNQWAWHKAGRSCNISAGKPAKASSPSPSIGFAVASSDRVSNNQMTADLIHFKEKYPPKAHQAEHRTSWPRCEWKSWCRTKRRCRTHVLVTGHLVTWQTASACNWRGEAHESQTHRPERCMYAWALCRFQFGWLAYIIFIISFKLDMVWRTCYCFHRNFHNHLRFTFACLNWLCFFHAFLRHVFQVTPRCCWVLPNSWRTWNSPARCATFGNGGSSG